MSRRCGGAACSRPTRRSPPDTTASRSASRALDGAELNMTRLALRFARYVNAVALRHRDVSQEMFPDFPIEAITNGVHATTWTSPPFRELFDRYIPDWRHDNLYLRYATTI